MDEIERTGERSTHPAATPSSLNAELLDQLADAVLVADADGHYVEANLASATLLGYSRAELLSMSVTDLTAGPQEQTEAEFERLSRDGYWRGTVELRRKDGSSVSVEARASVLETVEGRWGVAILRETGEEGRRTLRAAESRLASIIRSSDDAIFSVGPDGLIDAWNPAAERLYGYRAEEILGQHVRVTAPPERWDEVARNLELAMSGEHIRGLETVRLAKDGRRIDVSLTISPILDADGSVTGISSIARDVTERNRAERRARALSDLARSIDGASSEDDVFASALDALQRTLQVDRSGFLVSDEAGLRFRSSRGLSAGVEEALGGMGSWRGRDSLEPITVPDVRLEPGLADHRAAIDEAGIRSLAFLPLFHAGEPIGAAVACFDEPRDLTPEETQFAIALCGQVGVAIARLRAERSLADARDTLKLLTIGAGDGITIQDTNGRLVYANLASARLSGFDSVEAFVAAGPRERLANWEILDDLGEPIPVDRLPGRRVLGGEPEAEAVLRVRDRRDGHEFWSLVRSTASVDPSGNVRYAINVFRDITKQKQAELVSQGQARRMSDLYAITAELSATTDTVVIAEALAELAVGAFDADRGGVVVLTEDGTALETLAARGFDPASVERWKRFPLDARTPVGDAVLGNRPVVMSDRDAWLDRYPDLDPSKIPAAAAAIPLDVGRRAIGGVTLSFDEPRSFTEEDVGFMLAAARQGAQALERARSDEVRRRAETRLAVLAQAGGLLAESIDYPKTLAAVADLVVPRLADWATVEILEPDGSIRSLALAHVDPDKVAFAREFRERRPPDLSAPSGVGHVIVTGQPEIVPEITDEMIAAVDDPEVTQLVRELQLRSLMTVPLSARGRTLGALSFVWAESGNTYSSADLEFARTLAARIALVIDNARLYRDRDHVARTLQQSLLPPELPEIEGVELAARYLPSGEGIDVGGDFYDAFEIGDGEWTVALGDVCGKGPDAAALMSMVRHTIRATAIRERAPARVLATVNAAAMRQTSDDQFCTAVAARVRPLEGRVSVWLSVAGHPPPLILRGDGTIEWLRTVGSFLGVFEDAELLEIEVDLRPGDMLLLYTDGVTDERGPGGEFGEDGLVAVVSEAAGSTASELVDRIERAVLEHGGGEPRDDIAILALRVTP